MVQKQGGLHHAHVRKRIHEKHEPYPHPERFRRFMDKSIYVVAIVGPVMTIPQVTKIWISKNAAGISLISWVTYLITAFFWLIYGHLHKVKPIIFSGYLWIVLEVLIIIGAVLYG